jgi:Flp pilus assembly protein TadD
MLLRLLGQLREVFPALKNGVCGKPAPAKDGSTSSVPAISEEEARRAVELMPNYAQAHVNLGCIYANTERFAAAEAEFLLATKLERDNGPAHFNLGIVLAATNRLTGAEASYRRAIELMPTFAEAHNSLGMVLAASRRQIETSAVAEI